MSLYGESVAILVAFLALAPKFRFPLVSAPGASLTVGSWWHDAGWLVTPCGALVKWTVVPLVSSLMVRLNGRVRMGGGGKGIGSALGWVIVQWVPIIEATTAARAPLSLVVQGQVCCDPMVPFCDGSPLPLNPFHALALCGAVPGLAGFLVLGSVCFCWCFSLCLFDPLPSSPLATTVAVFPGSSSRLLTKLILWVQPG